MLDLLKFHHDVVMSDIINTCTHLEVLTLLEETSVPRITFAPRRSEGFEPEGAFKFYCALLKTQRMDDTFHV